MANQKISQLTNGNPAVGTDQIPINRGGSNFSITPTSILALAFPQAVANRVLLAQTSVDGASNASVLYTVPALSAGVYRISVGIVARTIQAGAAWTVNANWTPPAGTNISAQIGMGSNIQTGSPSSQPVSYSIYLHVSDVVSCGTVTATGGQTAGSFDVSWMLERII